MARLVRPGATGTGQSPHHSGRGPGPGDPQGPHRVILSLCWNADAASTGCSMRSSWSRTCRGCPLGEWVTRSRRWAVTPVSDSLPSSKTLVNASLRSAVPSPRPSVATARRTCSTLSARPARRWPPSTSSSPEADGEREAMRVLLATRQVRCARLHRSQPSTRRPTIMTTARAKALVPSSHSSALEGRSAGVT